MARYQKMVIFTDFFEYILIEYIISHKMSIIIIGKAIDLL